MEVQASPQWGPASSDPTTKVKTFLEKYLLLEKNINFFLQNTFKPRVLLAFNLRFSLALSRIISTTVQFNLPHQLAHSPRSINNPNVKSYSHQQMFGQRSANSKRESMLGLCRF